MQNTHLEWHYELNAFCQEGRFQSANCNIVGCRIVKRNTEKLFLKIIKSEHVREHRCNVGPSLTRLAAEGNDDIERRDLVSRALKRFTQAAL